MPSSCPDLTVGCIGAGMMATAIMDGLVAKGTVAGPDRISCADPNAAAVEAAQSKGYFASTSNADLLQHDTQLKVLLIAVKPQYVEPVCRDIAAHASKNETLIISVAAGVTLTTLQSALPGFRVVRVMPNTACLVGESASGFSMGSLATPEDKVVVETLFQSVGIALEQKEELLNAVTGLSGSGPAYVFQFIEALADGGVRVGLSRNDASLLAAQTVKGAAEMVLQTGRNPADLKNQVCSPGGTTIAGVDELEQGGFRSTTINAVKAATRRSFQLGGTPEETIRTKYNL